MIKIIKDGRVYIPASVIIRRMSDEIRIPGRLMTVIPSVGLAISEEDYNRLIREGVLGEDARMVVTKVEALEFKTDTAAMRRAFPLRREAPAGESGAEAGQETVTEENAAVEGRGEASPAGEGTPAEAAGERGHSREGNPAEAADAGKRGPDREENPAEAAGAGERSHSRERNPAEAADAGKMAPAGKGSPAGEAAPAGESASGGAAGAPEATATAEADVESHPGGAGPAGASPDACSPREAAGTAREADMGPQSPRGTGRDTAAPEEDEGPRFRHDSSFYGRISAVVEDARRRIAGAEDMLAALGLGVQCLTEIRPGAISFTYYLAGCGIFHEIEGDDLAAAGSFARTSDGRILFRSGRTGAGVELVEDGTLRDFRQYTVLDNIGWCLACLEVRSDNADEVSFHGGSFAFHAGMPLLMKYLNPDAFPDSLYLDGIPDITGMTSPLSFDKA